MARQWERLTRTRQWTTVWTGFTSELLSANSGVHLSTMEARPSTLAGDLIVAQEPAGGWLLRELKGESRSAAEVVMDDALIQDDGVDSIVAELNRCWEVTQDQDKASKIERASSRLRGTSKRKRPSCPMWREGNLRHCENLNLQKEAMTRW